MTAYRRRNHRFAARIARRADELSAARVVTVRPTAATPTLVELVTAFLDAYTANVAAKYSR